MGYPEMQPLENLKPKLGGKFVERFKNLYAFRSQAELLFKQIKDFKGDLDRFIILEIGPDIGEVIPGLANVEGMSDEEAVRISEEFFKRTLTGEKRQNFIDEVNQRAAVSKNLREGIEGAAE